MTVEVDALADAAMAKHGVCDTGLSAIDLEGMRLLAQDALAGEARLRADAHSALEWISQCVENAILLARRERDWPEVTQTPVKAPVFIISSARTGSTWLHRLLSLEPSFRVPQLWELRRPFPPCSAAEREGAVAAAERFVQLAPAGALALHPMAANRPDECHWLLRHNHARVMLHVAWRYWEWLRALSPDELLRLFGIYRRHLQVLQFADPSRLWVGKAPAHAHFWPVLFDVFPDARVIRVHRDPRQTLGSGCSLMQTFARGADPATIGELMVSLGRESARRAIDADRVAPLGATLDLAYEELVESPAETVRQLAAWLGAPSPDELGARVARYLKAPQRMRAAPHRYDLEEFGLTEAETLDLFEEYIAWARSKLDARFAR